MRSPGELTVECGKDRVAIEASRLSEWRAMMLYTEVGNSYNHLLDVNAGGGEILFYFRSAGYRVEGWSKSQKEVESLRESGYPTRLVDLDRDSLDGRYDIIACCGLLEYSQDPAAIIRKLGAILNPAGRIFIATPNDYAITNSLWTSNEKKTRFSPARTRELVEVAGLHVEKVLYQPVFPLTGMGLNKISQFLADHFPILFCTSVMNLVKK